MRRNRRTKAAITAWYESWWNADLSYLLRPHGQTRLHTFIKDCWAKSPGSGAPVVAECHRRMGKSFDIIALAVETCLAKPSAVAKIGAPTEKQAKEIVELDLADLLRDCPEEFRPRTRGNCWFFRNPKWQSREESLLKIVGCDYKKGDHLRGSGIDFLGLDEAGYTEHLEDIIKNVIAPQFDRTPDPRFLIASTPPKSMDHYFVRPGGLVTKAMSVGRHIVIPGHENPDFTEKEKRKYLEAANITEESIEYRREIGCEHLSDEHSLVVPEFRANKELVLDVPPVPAYWVPYTVMDTGYVDRTAVLFGYVDFERQLIVVQDMIWVRYETLGALAVMIREKEMELHGSLGNPKGTVFGHPRIDMIRRLADCTELEINTLSTDFDMHFEPVEKYDKNAAIAKFRTAIQRGAFRINPETCKPLIHQLEAAVWNDRRTDFERSDTLGHCDALVAAVYMNRMADLNENPFPDAIKVNWNDQWWEGHYGKKRQDHMLGLFGLGTGYNDAN